MMTPSTVMELGRGALEVAFMVAAPMFVAALVTGLIIRIREAATQIIETTLSFAP